MTLRLENFAIVKMGKIVSIFQAGKLLKTGLNSIDAAFAYIETKRGYAIASAEIKES